MIYPALDQRPVIVAIAGPNGAGKTTFFHAHLSEAGLRFVNADDIACELDMPAYEAAKIADALRRELVKQRESFIFETVFSDPVGEKLAFLKNAAMTGCNVVLCFIGISTPETSEQRVAMRVTQGGHDVPSEKLAARYPRTMLNLKAAIQALPIVLIFDNDNLAAPFQKIAEVRSGKSVFLAEPIPRWLGSALALGEFVIPARFQTHTGKFAGRNIDPCSWAFDPQTAQRLRTCSRSLTHAATGRNALQAQRLCSAVTPKTPASISCLSMRQDSRPACNNC